MVNVDHLNKNLDDILKLAVMALRPPLDHAISKAAPRIIDREGNLLDCRKACDHV